MLVLVLVMVLVLVLMMLHGLLRVGRDMVRVDWRGRAIHRRWGHLRRDGVLSLRHCLARLDLGFRRY